MKWFGQSWGGLVNEDCEQVATPTEGICARCMERIGITSGVLMWHVGLEGAEYSPLHYACFMRGVTGSIGHVLLHGRGTCSGECPPDPDWLNKRRAAELAVQLWELAPLPVELLDDLI